MRKYEKKHLPVNIPSLNIFYEYSDTLMIEYLEWPHVRVYEFGKASVPLIRILTITKPYFSANKDTVYLSSSRPIRIPKVLDMMKHVSKLKKRKQLV